MIEPSALLAAAQWIQDVLLGTTATALAIIAVAGLGYLLLTGRIDVRRGATIVLGCFILFGAPVIARALYSLTTLTDTGASPTVTAVEPAPYPVVTRPAGPPPVYDPYAGASVPPR